MKTICIILISIVNISFARSEDLIEVNCEARQFRQLNELSTSSMVFQRKPLFVKAQLVKGKLLGSIQGLKNVEIPSIPIRETNLNPADQNYRQKVTNYFTKVTLNENLKKATYIRQLQFQKSNTEDLLLYYAAIDEKGIIDQFIFLPEFQLVGICNNHPRRFPEIVRDCSDEAIHKIRQVMRVGDYQDGTVELWYDGMSRLNAMAQKIFYSAPVLWTDGRPSEILVTIYTYSSMPGKCFYE
jgi:hypothetical protein